mmetsp:Transcript_60239/g.143580  ORF Transcript_60239/g.143580 Transcript_60239/m.143580 type:complete len:175 (-) Transcript_60239:204-728(-)
MLTTPRGRPRSRPRGRELRGSLGTGPRPSTPDESLRPRSPPEPEPEARTISKDLPETQAIVVEGRLGLLQQDCKRLQDYAWQQSGADTPRWRRLPPNSAGTLQSQSSLPPPRDFPARESLRREYPLTASSEMEPGQRDDETCIACIPLMSVPASFEASEVRRSCSASLGMCSIQ